MEIRGVVHIVDGACRGTVLPTVEIFNTDTGKSMIFFQVLHDPAPEWIPNRLCQNCARTIGSHQTPTVGTTGQTCGNRLRLLPMASDGAR